MIDMVRVKDKRAGSDNGLYHSLRFSHSLPFFFLSPPSPRFLTPSLSLRSLPSKSYKFKVPVFPRDL